MRMPVLSTPRLVIRPFVRDDLAAIDSFGDALAEINTGEDETERRAVLDRWLQWAVLNHEQLARLHQPPYGDRAVVLRQTDQVIGACGFVPCLDAFGRVPTLAHDTADPATRLTSTEFGLFWAIAPAHQQLGYATEAAAAMIDYAFAHLRLRRVIATTAHDNFASQSVMRKLGMRIERNPFPEPPWLQVVGILTNPLVSVDTTARSGA